MTSSSHSALASLTATYTDSEDEDVEDPESGNIELIERSSAANSPQEDSNSNSRDAQSLASSGGGESNKSGGKAGGGGGALGLVSYQDDLIDDDAVDDHYTSDSNPALDPDQPSELQDNDNNEMSTDGSRKATLENAAQEEIGPDVINLDGDESSSTSRKSSRIPPEPLGKCSSELVDKITKLYERKIKGGLDINSLIQKNKNFRNPSIYEKLIKYCDIDELGSNYPRDVFDPHEWHESSYFDELAKVQKAEMERREKERKDRTKVDFVLGTVKKPSVPVGLPQQGVTEAETRRKSKWDQRGVMPPLMMNIAPPTTQPPVGSVQPSLTTSASGTKSTVISAFGSIKKPKT